MADERDGEHEERLDELVARVVVAEERGEAGALERACAEHPALAAALRERCAGLARVRGLFEQARADEAADERVPDRLGPYVLERELGRGGMGVVYLARDERLGRVVALKALSAPLLAGARGLERFQREARAVARLEHPCIVPIFDVGEEDGRPWFTMEHVEGRTLSDALAELRDLGLAPARLAGTHLGRATGAHARADGAGAPDESRHDPAVVALGADWSRSYVESCCRIALDVADALQHAHERGVVHRDVKPSNVIVRPDGRALLFDFGLARVDAGSSMTLTGEFVGTPFYVSPEQVAGGRDELDARTDVYSLGVTLYELLALDVPFRGESSQEIFRRILTKEPAPLRRRNPSVPRDLETICATAMAKEPAKRYPSAGELAADLRRFLEYRPVVARPVGPVSRSWRWARRNPSQAAAGALAVALVVGGPLVFGVHSRLAAERLERERDRADRHLQRALDAVDEMLTRVAESRLRHVPQMEAVRHDLLQKALEFYQGFLAEQEGDPVIALGTARAYTRYGQILTELGRLEEARAALEAGLAMLEELLAADPADPELCSARSSLLTNLGIERRAAGDAEAALALGRRALADRRAIAAARPKDAEARRLLSDALVNVGVALAALGRREAAIRSYRESVAISRERHDERPDDPEAAFDLGSVTMNLAAVLDDVGEHEEAAELARRADATWRAALAADPGWTEARYCFVATLSNLSQSLRALGADEEAEPLLREALAAAEALCRDHPGVRELDEARATALANLLQLLDDQGRTAEAAPLHERNFALAEELGAAYPEVPLRRRQLARACLLRADALLAQERWSEAGALLERAVALAEELVAERADDPEDRSVLGQALNNLALLRFDRGELEEVPPLLERAIASQEAAVAADPDNDGYRTFLRNHWWGLAETRLRLGDHAGAADAAERLSSARPNRVEELVRSAELLAQATELARADEALDETARAAAAEDYAARAASVLAIALELGLPEQELSESSMLDPIRSSAPFQDLELATSGR